MIMDNDTLYAFFLRVQFNTLAFKATSETPPCVFFPYLAYPGCSSEAGFEAQTHSSHQRPPLVFPPFSQFWQHLPAWRWLAWFSSYTKNPGEPARSARFLLYMNLSIGSFSTWPGNANTQHLRLRISSYFICFYAEDHEPYSESFLLQPFQTSSSSPQPLSPTCKPQANFGPTNSSCLSIIYTRYDKGQQEYFLQLMWNKSCMAKTSELRSLYHKLIFWFSTIYTQKPM